MSNMKKNHRYCNAPKLSDGWVVGQIRMLTRVYTLCHSICTFWTHYSIVEPPCSNLRVITENFSGVQNFRIFTILLFCLLVLGPNIHWTSKYDTGIVFIGKMLSWLSFHNSVWWSLISPISITSPDIWDFFKKIDQTSVKLMSHLRKMTKLTKWKSDKNKLQD